MRQDECNGQPDGGALAIHARDGALTVPTITVRTTARLHLGFLDLNFDLGRRFGSIGLSLDAPATVLTLRQDTRPSVTGTEHERAAAALATLTRYLNVRAGHALHVSETIPPHTGLGSGTQLALAVAAALRRLHGLPPDRHGDALRLGRGRRSGIGIGLFRSGGLVVDGGHGADTAIPPIITRMAVPPRWRILLAIDPEREGLSDAPERAAFAALPPMSSADAGLLCRLVLMRALPAVAEANLAEFGAALAEVQRIVGDYFAPAQGGRFSSPRVAALLDLWQSLGACGIGQSSWGPTGFAFVDDVETANRIIGESRLDPRAQGLDIRVCRALNRGATITAS